MKTVCESPFNEETWLSTLQELNFDIRHAGALTLGRLGGALQALNFDIRHAGALTLGRLDGALQEPILQYKFDFRLA